MSEAGEAQDGDVSVDGRVFVVANGLFGTAVLESFCFASKLPCERHSWHQVPQDDCKSRVERFRSGAAGRYGRSCTCRPCRAARRIARFASGPTTARRARRHCLVRPTTSCCWARRLASPAKWLPHPSQSCHSGHHVAVVRQSLSVTCGGLLEALCCAACCMPHAAVRPSIQHAAPSTVQPAASHPPACSCHAIRTSSDASPWCTGVEASGGCCCPTTRMQKGTVQERARRVQRASSSPSTARMLSGSKAAPTVSLAFTAYNFTRMQLAPSVSVADKRTH